MRNFGPIYIQAAAQVSIQQPLSDEWMIQPVSYDDVFVEAINPNYRDFLAANEARRMGKLMKRALVVAKSVLQETHTEHPDAIITGTCLGSLDYTVRLLDELADHGEETTVSPTFFMQSTHNTVGSTLGIYTKSHGYNVTYSHDAVSFDMALRDAFLQLRLGKIATALVGGYEEMVASYFDLLRQTGYVGQEGMVPCSETSFAMLLTSRLPSPDSCLPTPDSCLQSPASLCELAGVRLLHQPDDSVLDREITRLYADAGLTIGETTALLLGVNGCQENDRQYLEIARKHFPGVRLLQYKNLFGENYCVSGLGIYAAAMCLKRQMIPSSMSFGDSQQTAPPQSILLLNISGGREVSMILLKG